MAAVDDQTPRAQLTASPDGRVTIPAPLRRAAGIEPGRRLVAYVEDGRVVLEEWEHLLRRVQRRVIAATSGHSGSAADALIADRRAEAAHEDVSADATLAGRGAHGPDPA
ncbi:looped-hinge helix DNA binding domain-containing protein, AbrB family [Amycolatopsis arida]|uniref:Looped-hinge helix DNA binding domain-containing protein, AbrB family n=1 Tax=Amycolatopsis arida TaxID=587909 RepID=A0A1I5ZX04_9PSEU|nr:AbrB/MazE/SpoVT family DNA-binding domain-containing protein [Amycolatopsis arida]TDX89420.1 AbrB family looped-hinge helix DNA binding protein [Amycolatopsis arida]SFQ60817.1 looped-hinge helix DNA binding domain-containing protein, AbrB family [Amycolatopsis arida]